MEQNKFRAQVTKDTWATLQVCIAYLGQQKASDALCICCPNTSGGQSFVLWTAEETRYANSKPTDGRWRHHTLAALDRKREEEAQRLKDEQLLRMATLVAKGVMMAARQVAAEAEEAFYKDVIHAKPTTRRVSAPRVPRVKVDAGVTLKQIIDVVAKNGGPIDIVSVACELDAMEGIRARQYDRVLEMGIKFGALINNRGWLTLPAKKEK